MCLCLGNLCPLRSLTSAHCVFSSTDAASAGELSTGENAISPRVAWSLCKTVLDEDNTSHEVHLVACVFFVEKSLAERTSYCRRDRLLFRGQLTSRGFISRGEGTKGRKLGNREDRNSRSTSTRHQPSSTGECSVVRVTKGPYACGGSVEVHVHEEIVSPV